MSDISIKNAIDNGLLRIEPFNDEYLRPCSLCLTLGSLILEPQWRDIIKVDDKDTYPISERIIDISCSGYTLKPGSFVLGITEEKIGLRNNLAGIILNISGLSRIGLNIMSPCLVSPGYGSDKMSVLTVEITNHSPSAIELIRGMRVCHISFVLLDKESRGNYDQDVGVYSEQYEPLLSAFHKNWK